MAVDITIEQQNNTLLTLFTNQKYVDHNLQYRFGVQGASATLSASSSSEVENTQATGTGTNISGVVGQKSSIEPSGYFLRVKSTGTGNFVVSTPGWVNDTMSPASGSETAYYPIDAAAGSVSGTNTVTPTASISGSHVTLSNDDNGISVTSTGGGSASASASASISAAGYIPEGTLDTETINAAAVTTTSSSFISGVTLEAPSTGTRSFSITVPDGNSTVTFTYTVDSNGNVVVE